MEVLGFLALVLFFAALYTVEVFLVLNNSPKNLVILIVLLFVILGGLGSMILDCISLNF